MSSAGDLAVAEARKWIGTPYVHQASRCGAGCDCLGLLRGVWRSLYGREPVSVPRYSPDWDEPQHGEVLLQAARRHLRAVPEGRGLPGDVLLFRMRTGAVAKHLGLVSRIEDARFIHAYAGHGVIESPLSHPWRRRIVARFRFPVLPG